MRSSRLPVVKTLADFAFSFQPSVNREQVESLHTLGFVERKENVVFRGPPGVGKTHLAICLEIAAAESSRRVYYGTLADLIASLEDAQMDGRLAARLKTLVSPRCWSSTRSGICRSVVSVQEARVALEGGRVLRGSS